LRLTTASEDGTYYPVGGFMKEKWNKTLQSFNIEVKIQDSKGSVDNIKRLRAKKAELAIMTNFVANKAEEYKEDYNVPRYKDFRAITSLWADVHHFVISSQYKNINYVDQLPDKFRFYVGGTDSGTQVSTNLFLDTLIGKGKVVREYGKEGTYGEAKELLIAGTYDGVSLSGGIPVRAVKELFEKHPNKFKILNFRPQHLLDLKFVLNRSIGEGHHPYGLDAPVNSVAEPNLLVVNADVDNWIVYFLTKMFFENLKELQNSHHALKEVSLEKALNRLSVPLHPGACIYYQEQKLKQRVKFETPLFEVGCK